jgi:cytidyltransferase-like protein
MKILFPGSFDPFTNGHADILKRAQLMGFAPDVCFLDNPNKIRKFRRFYYAKEECYKL